MWEQLRPADIERAKRQLAIQRGETLKRHAEELKTLDSDEAEIQTFERLVAAFVSKHISPSAQATLTSEEDTATAETSEPSEPRQEQIAVPPRLQVHHQPSPNFGVPFRKLVGG